MGKPLVVLYTNLLHKYKSPKAKAVLKFVEKHKGNTEFIARVKALNTEFSKAYKKLLKFEAEEKQESNGYSWFSNLMYSFERWLDKHNHKMELLRTLASLTAAVLSGIVLAKLFGFI